MVRGNRVSLGFDDSEYEKLKARASEAHLKLGDYIRWYMFKPNEAPHIQYHHPQQQTTIPYMASKEVIERIKSGKKGYVEPNQAAKLAARKEFSESGGFGELHNKIKMKGKGGRVLQKIPKGDLKEIAKQKEERKHVTNKHLEIFKEIKLQGSYK